MNLPEANIPHVGINLPTVLTLVLSTVVFVHLVPFIADPFSQRRIPGPFLAKFSDLWLGWVSSHGHRSDIVHELHKKYGTVPMSTCHCNIIDAREGPLVRLAPNHVSIANPDALHIVYAHGNGSLKSDFYDAFVSIHRGLFNTRDRAQHTRKRKIVSHTFSPKSMLEFEPIARSYVDQLFKQWDRLYDSAIKGGAGTDGESGWYGRDGRLWLDCLPCRCSDPRVLEIVLISRCRVQLSCLRYHWWARLLFHNCFG